MKKLLYIWALVFLTSCEYFGLQENKNDTNQAIASVYNEKLYRKDIEDLFPKNIDRKDSIILVRSIINDWATKQLLLRKAEENNSKTDNKDINQLVKDYRQALLINGYKERLIKQQLDTVISKEETENYYAENSKNFRLNEELIKVRYLHFSEELLDKKEVTSFFKKGKIEDLEELEIRQLSFKSMLLNDSIWTPIENVLLKTPFSRDILLKKNKILPKTR